MCPTNMQSYAMKICVISMSVCQPSLFPLLSESNLLTHLEPDPELYMCPTHCAVYRLILAQPAVVVFNTEGVNPYPKCANICIEELK